MKKTIITILILLVIAIGAYAANYDQALIDLWNRRPDLQKAFPGTPYDNKKLEAWAAKYGWQEAPELYNFYPQKQIVEKIIESKTSDRIKTLENQINSLNGRIADLEWKQIQAKAATAGKWVRYCFRTDPSPEFNIPKRMQDGQFCGDSTGKPWETIYLFQQ
jgi:hypothetical protein